MHKIDRSALVNYSAQQMFNLVNDVESYPEFMDGCVGAKILKRSEQEIEAQLELSKVGFSSRFVTRNRFNSPHNMSIELVEGPFNYLQGAWLFTPLNDTACKVSFTLEFEFNNRLLGFAAAKLFEAITSKQVDALCRRAEQIYKKH